MEKYLQITTQRVLMPLIYEKLKIQKQKTVNTLYKKWITVINAEFTGGKEGIGPEDNKIYSVLLEKCKTKWELIITFHLSDG